MAFSPLRNMSLYIGHVFPNISGNRISNVFKKLRIGQVNRVDFVKRFDKNGDRYNAVYVHFDFWYHNEATINLQRRIMNPHEEAKIVYDDPWFWIVKEDNSSKKIKNQAWIKHLHAWEECKKSVNECQQLYEKYQAALVKHDEYQQERADAWKQFCQESGLMWNAPATAFDTAFIKDRTCFGDASHEKFMTYADVKLRIKTIETILEDCDDMRPTRGEVEIISKLSFELEILRECIQRYVLAPKIQANNAAVETIEVDAEHAV